MSGNSTEPRIAVLAIDDPESEEKIVPPAIETTASPARRKRLCPNPPMAHISAARKVAISTARPSASCSLSTLSPTKITSTSLR